MLLFVLGVIGVYSALFATGHFIYGNIPTALGLSVIVIACIGFLINSFKKIQTKR